MKDVFDCFQAGKFPEGDLWPKWENAVLEEMQKGVMALHGVSLNTGSRCLQVLSDDLQVMIIDKNINMLEEISERINECSKDSKYMCLACQKIDNGGN